MHVRRCECRPRFRLSSIFDRLVNRTELRFRRVSLRFPSLDPPRSLNLSEPNIFPRRRRLRTDDICDNVTRIYVDNYRFN